MPSIEQGTCLHAPRFSLDAPERQCYSIKLVMVGNYYIVNCAKYDANSIGFKYHYPSGKFDLPGYSRVRSVLWYPNTAVAQVVQTM